MHGSVLGGVAPLVIVIENGAVRRESVLSFSPLTTRGKVAVCVSSHWVVKVLLLGDGCEERFAGGGLSFCEDGDKLFGKCHLCNDRSVFSHASGRNQRGPYGKRFGVEKIEVCGGGPNLSTRIPVKVVA